MTSSRATGRCGATGACQQPLTAAEVEQELSQMLELLLYQSGPEDLLEVLLGATDDWLPNTTIDGVLAGWSGLVEGGCDPLHAELAGLDFVAMTRDHAGDEQAGLELLRDLMAEAEATASPEALAMHRALSVVGPPALRGACAEAAVRLVGTGLRDPDWVAVVGRPRVSSCFGYDDLFGAQEIVAITFAYGRRRHALSVLIDHELGGGIKDVWVTNRATQLRSFLRDAADADGTELERYSAEQAGALLTKALSNPPCPVERDQVQDVDCYVGLLEQRVALLT